jgi:hypothetical protein
MDEECNHNFVPYKTNDGKQHVICTRCGTTDLDE